MTNSPYVSNLLTIMEPFLFTARLHMPFSLCWFCSTSGHTWNWCQSQRTGESVSPHERSAPGSPGLSPAMNVSHLDNILMFAACVNWQMVTLPWSDPLHISQSTLQWKTVHRVLEINHLLVSEDSGVGTGCTFVAFAILIIIRLI